MTPIAAATALDATTTAAQEGPTITVNTAGELWHALTELTEAGGGTVRLVDNGEPYFLERYKIGPEDGTIRITSDDPDNPAVFSRVELNKAQNLTFDGLEFDSTETANGSRDIQVQDSENIAIVNSSFTSASDGYFTGTGTANIGNNVAHFQDSTGITIAGNDVTGYGQGISMRDVTDILISDNSFSEMTYDGIRVSGVQDILIENNTFSDFYGSSYNINHPDMIQVWSSHLNELNTENLTIRGNTFDASAGSGNQTIFVKNENPEATGMRFQNVTIEDNVIHNAHLHGITAYSVEGLTITNNLLIWNPGATVQSHPSADPVSRAPEIRVQDSPDAIIDGNLADAVRSDMDYEGENTVINKPTLETEEVQTYLNGGDVDPNQFSSLEPYVPEAPAFEEYLSVDFDGAIADGSTYGSKLAARAAAEDETEAETFTLTGTSQLRIDRSNGQLQSMDRFAIELDLRVDEGSEPGVFMHMHKSLSAEVTETGAVHFTMSPEGQVFEVTTRDGLITEGNWHDVAIAYDPGGAGLTIHVDGVLEAQNTEAVGTLDGNSKYSLIVGNTWNESLQGEVDNLLITNGLEDASDPEPTPEPDVDAAPEPTPTPEPTPAPMPDVDLAPVDPQVEEVPETPQVDVVTPEPEAEPDAREWDFEIAHLISPIAAQEEMVAADCECIIDSSTAQEMVYEEPALLAAPASFDLLIGWKDSESLSPEVPAVDWTPTEVEEPTNGMLLADALGELF